MSLNNGYIVDYEVLKKCATLPSIEELEAHEDKNDYWQITVDAVRYTGMHRIFLAEGIVEGDLENGHWYVVFGDQDLYETRKSGLGEALEEADAFPDDLTWEDDQT